MFVGGMSCSETVASEAVDTHGMTGKSDISITANLNSLTDVQPAPSCCSNLSLLLCYIDGRTENFACARLVCTGLRSSRHRLFVAEHVLAYVGNWKTKFRTLRTVVSSSSTLLANSKYAPRQQGRASEPQYVLSSVDTSVQACS